MFFWNIRVNHGRPDFVIVSPELELLVLDVKDWVLGTVCKSDSKNFYFKPDNKSQLNPLEQAEKYRQKIEKLLGTEIELLQK